MVTVSTLQSQVQQARTQLQERITSIEEEQARIQQQERLMASLRTKKPQRKLGFQVDPRYAQQLQKHLAEQKFKREQTEKIKEAKEKIKGYQKGSLDPYEKQIEKAEGQISSYEAQVQAYQRSQQREQKAYETARSLYHDHPKFLRSYLKQTLQDTPELKYLKLFYQAETAAKEAFESRQKASIVPQFEYFTYKDPFTGQMFSMLPEHAPKHFIPTAITPSGVELPFFEQVKFRAEKPELFAPLEIEEPTKFDLKEYGFVERIPTRETIGAPTQVLIPKGELPKLYEEIPKTIWKEVKMEGVVGKGISSIVEHTIKGIDISTEKILGYIPEAYFKPPKISPFGVDIGEIGFREPTDYKKKIKEKQEEIVAKEIKELKIEEIISPKYTFTQIEFEKRWGEQITKGEIKFEVAAKLFEESKFYKEAMESYSKDIQKEYERIKKEQGITRIKESDIELAKYGLLGVIPRTPGEIVVTGAALYGFYKGITKLPKLITYPYFFGYRPVKATYEIVSPKTMPVEKLMGIAELGLTAGFASYIGIKHLKVPVIKTQELLLAPRLKEFKKTLKISPKVETKVFQVGEEKLIKDIYKMSKMDEQLIMGRRTIVTTKGKEMWRRGWEHIGVSPKAARTGLAKPLYEGVPYLEDKRILRSLRADVIYKEPQARAKALKRLKKYGLTEAEAKQALRYIQPKRLLYATTGEAEIIYGTKVTKPIIKVKGVRVQEFIKEDINKLLGIKTRVGKRRIDFIKAVGEEIKEVKDISLYKFITETEKALLTKEGYPYTPVKKLGKLKTIYEQISLVKPIEKIKLFDDKLEAELLKEVTVVKQIIPKKIKPFAPTKGKIIKFLTKEEAPVITYDVEELLGLIKVRKIPTYRKPEKISKEVDVEELYKTLKSIYGEPKKVISPPKKFVPTSYKDVQIMKDIPRQKIVEKLGGALPKMPSQKNVLKDITRIEDRLMKATKFKVDVETKLATGLAVRTKLRTGVKLGQSFAQIEREALKTSVDVKQTFRQQQRFKQAQKLRLKQTQIMKQLLAPVPVTRLGVRMPSIKLPKIPLTKIPLFLFPDFKKAVRKKLRKKRLRKEIYAYTPSIIMRGIMDLKPIKVEEPNVGKLLKKMRTGLGIRRPVIIVKAKKKTSKRRKNERR